ncbi:hypothetical protein [Bacillus badius]|uniref:Lipoprotein n=1 Tax=Bacillus badius TaxID=1455 RepID=A0ABR5AP98_BACBA|nr:hypothetical protein [Bacillus badius]KIL74182.1 hypothetical protein SD77_2923 [Bacillus badius]MED4718175.1 hypothetical protein [Bacillus badius]
MKKNWILGSALLSFGLILGGCGEETSSPKQETNSAEKEKNNDAAHKQDYQKKEDTEDTKFSNEVGDFEILGLYRNEKSSEKDASFVIDFEGFTMKVIPTLVDITPNEYSSDPDLFQESDTARAIMLTVEAENTTDFDVDYVGGITAVTDTKEQISAKTGLASENAAVTTYQGKVKEQGYSLFVLKDGKSTPKDITLIFEPPYKVVDGAVDGTRLGEEQRIEFTYTAAKDLK